MLLRLRVGRTNDKNAELIKGLFLEPWASCPNVAQRIIEHLFFFLLRQANFNKRNYRIKKR
jgi:hypothetical protein